MQNMWLPSQKNVLGPSKIIFQHISTYSHEIPQILNFPSGKLRLTLQAKISRPFVLSQIGISWTFLCVAGHGQFQWFWLIVKPWMDITIDHSERSKTMNDSMDIHGQIQWSEWFWRFTHLNHSSHLERIRPIQFPSVTSRCEVMMKSIQNDVSALSLDLWSKIFHHSSG